MAVGDAPPVEVPQPPSPKKSFPLRDFEVHGLLRDGPTFLDDFQRHWPADDANTYVDFGRDGIHGNGAARIGNARWWRVTEERAGSAKFRPGALPMLRSNQPAEAAASPFRAARAISTTPSAPPLGFLASTETAASRPS